MNILNSSFKQINWFLENNIYFIVKKDDKVDPTKIKVNKPKCAAFCTKRARNLMKDYIERELLSLIR